MKKTRAPKSSFNIQSAMDRAAEAYRAHDFAESAALYARIPRGGPDYVAARYQLAMIALKQNRLKKAIEEFKTVLSLDAQSFVAHYNLGYAYQQLGQWKDAADSYARAHALAPNDVPTLFGLAAAFAFLGRMTDAIAAYRLLTRDPEAYLEALIRLCILDSAQITADDLAALEQAQKLKLNVHQQIALHFALGEVFERQRRFGDAFSAFLIGNKLKKESLRDEFRPEVIAHAHQKIIDELKARFSADFLRENASRGNPSVAPIFIVGMPRSGSTLVEQIISSHSEVQGLGESSALVQVVGTNYATDPRLTQRVAKLAADYLSAMRQAGWKAAPHFVDKMLDNYLHIGLIHLMFPNAVILHTARGAIDTCVGCFRQLFTGTGNETTYDLQDIAAEYRRYRDMMAHWERVLPNRIVTVKYEELVADPDHRIRWLIASACKLRWEDRCLEFFSIEQPVKTASTQQVRRPIFSDSLQRWRKYERHLQPLLDALGEYSKE